MNKFFLNLFCITILFFCIPLISSSQKSELSKKHVIGCEPNGFFSIFFGVLNHLSWCEKNRAVPVVYWGLDCLYYQPEGYNGSANAWEYYFEPVSKEIYTPGEIIYNLYHSPDNGCIEYRIFSGLSLYNHKDTAHRLIRRYIKIKPNILAKIDDFYKTHMAGKKTVAIHLRGTDKYKECRQIPAEILLDTANRYKNCQFFVASDEEELLQLAKKKLHGKVIFYNSTRSKDGQPLHLSSDKNKAILGEEVLIEVLLLSKCHRFIHTTSNVSAAVYFFNPKMHGIIFTIFGNALKIEPTPKKYDRLFL